jgi:hypothetical protein
VQRAGGAHVTAVAAVDAVAILPTTNADPDRDADGGPHAHAHGHEASPAHAHGEAVPDDYPHAHPETTVGLPDGGAGAGGLARAAHESIFYP